MGDLRQLAKGGWECDVCHTRRPDEMIGVAQHSHTDANGVTVLMNVKYCLDRELCTHTAKVRSVADLALVEANQEISALQAALMDYHEKLIWQRATFALIGFILGFFIGTTV